LRFTPHNRAADDVEVQLDEDVQDVLAERWDGRTLGGYGFAWLSA